MENKPRIHIANKWVKLGVERSASTSPTTSLLAIFHGTKYFRNKSKDLRKILARICCKSCKKLFYRSNTRRQCIDQWFLFFFLRFPPFPFNLLDLILPQKKTFNLESIFFFFVKLKTFFEINFLKVVTVHPLDCLKSFFGKEENCFQK